MPWKTTCQYEQRWKFMQAFLCHKTPLNVLCRRWAITRKTACKWLARFKERGRSGLTDQRRAARRRHNRPPELRPKGLQRWRRRGPTWGAPKLRWARQRRFGHKGLPSESAISRWLQRWGLTRPRPRIIVKGPVVGRPKLTVPKKPRQVWPVDGKGWFRTAMERAWIGGRSQTWPAVMLWPLIF